MTPALRLISDLQSIDAKLAVKQGDIAINAPTGTVTQAMLQRLKLLKGEVIAELVSDKCQPAKVVGDPAPCAVDFAERAAILEYDSGRGRDEAEQAAAQELDYVNAVAFYETKLAGWQRELHRLARTAVTQRAKEVIRDAGAFLSDWGLTTLQMGWDEQDLFRCTVHDLEAIGMYPGFGKKPQLQRLGLIFFIRGGRVELVTRETASIRTTGGQLHHFRRFGPGHNQGAPIWETVRHE